MYVYICIDMYVYIYVHIHTIYMFKNCKHKMSASFVSTLRRPEVGRAVGPLAR